MSKENRFSCQESTTEKDPSFFHPLIGKLIEFSKNKILFQNHIRKDYPEYFEHHRVFSRIVFPAAAFLEMAFAAGKVVFRTENLTLEKVYIYKPLILSEKEETIQMILSWENKKTCSFKIFSQENEIKSKNPSLIKHVSGKLYKTEDVKESSFSNLPAYKDRIVDETPVSVFYRKLKKIGLHYGPGFRTVKQLWHKDHETLGYIQLPEHLMSIKEDYIVHPALLDGCIQILCSVVSEKERNQTFLPVKIKHLRLFCSLEDRLWCLTRTLPAKSPGQKTHSADLKLFTPEGKLAVEFTGLRLIQAKQEAFLHNPATP